MPAFVVFETSGVICCGAMSMLSMLVCCAKSIRRRNDEMEGQTSPAAAAENAESEHEIQDFAHQVRCVRDGIDLGFGTVKLNGEILELPCLPRELGTLALGNMTVENQGRTVELRPKELFIQKFVMHFNDEPEAAIWGRQLQESASHFASSEHTRLMQLRNIARAQETTIKNLTIRYNKRMRIDRMERYRELGRSKKPKPKAGAQAKKQSRRGKVTDAWWAAIMRSKKAEHHEHHRQKHRVDSHLQEVLGNLIRHHDPSEDDYQNIEDQAAMIDPISGDFLEHPPVDDTKGPPVDDAKESEPNQSSFYGSLLDQELGNLKWDGLTATSGVDSGIGGLSPQSASRPLTPGSYSSVRLTSDYSPKSLSPESTTRSAKHSPESTTRSLTLRLDALQVPDRKQHQLPRLSPGTSPESFLTDSSYRSLRPVLEEPVDLPKVMSPTLGQRMEALGLKTHSILERAQARQKSTDTIDNHPSLTKHYISPMLDKLQNNGKSSGLAPTSNDKYSPQKPKVSPIIEKLQNDVRSSGLSASDDKGSPRSFSKRSFSPMLEKLKSQGRSSELKVQSLGRSSGLTSSSEDKSSPQGLSKEIASPLLEKVRREGITSVSNPPVLTASLAQKPEGTDKAGSFDSKLKAFPKMPERRQSENGISPSLQQKLDSLAVKNGRNSLNFLTARGPLSGSETSSSKYIGDRLAGCPPTVDRKMADLQGWMTRKRNPTF